MDLLRALLRVFQERPSSEIEWAITQHTLLVNLVLDAQGLPVAETAGRLPPAFTALLQLSLVDTPVALAAALTSVKPAASGGYVPYEPQQLLCNASWFAATLLGRFARARYFQTQQRLQVIWQASAAFFQLT